MSKGNWKNHEKSKIYSFTMKPSENKVLKELAEKKKMNVSNFIVEEIVRPELIRREEENDRQ